MVEKFVYISDNPGLPRTRIENLYEYEEIIKEQLDYFLSRAVKPAKD